MSTIETVKIMDISQNVTKRKKDGGTYTVTTILAKSNEGKVEHNILQNIVDRNAAMKSAVESLEMGDTATLVLETRPGSKFSNVVGVHSGNVPEAVSQLGESTGGFQKRPNTTATKEWQPADTTGVQVGNALNNAALLLAHKIEKGTLEEVAERVLRTAENLKTKLKAGVYSTSTETRREPSRPQTQVNTFVEDDDISFE